MQVDYDDKNRNLIFNSVGSLKDEKLLANDDLTYSDNVHLSKHNEEFSELLFEYVENYKKACKIKLSARKKMFCASVVILLMTTFTVVGAVIWGCVFITMNKGDITAVLPTIVGAVVSLVSAFMVIPQIIANYFYNSDEEKYLSDIIGKIQDYDSRIREKK